MVGRVFISCGQRPLRERDTANRIKQLLKDKFGLDSYVAVNIQGFNDIMRITDELRHADYYLFIDFLRHDPDDLPFSLFTHQELAVAHNLGFTDMIALREKGTPIEGFLRYIQSNPIEFDNDEDLMKKVEGLVREREWSRNYSRNLVLTNISERIGPFFYGDHTGAHNQFIWHARIENRRPDVAAVNTLCVLDSIDSKERRVENPDRSNLKWARQQGYERTILPLDYGLIDIISIREDEERTLLT